MFAPYPARKTDVPANGSAQWSGNGTHDRRRWKGPNNAGGRSWLADLFTGKTRQSERKAYEDAHTGVVYDKAAKATKEVPGVASFYSFAPAFPDPTTGRTLQPRSYNAATELYEYLVQDTEYLDDVAAQKNAATEHRRKTFETFWVDDDVLKLACSKEFFDALAAKADGGDTGMPDSLRSAEARPNILRHFVSGPGGGSMEHSLGCSKADYLMATRNDGPGTGIMQTGGNKHGLPPGTHKKETRSADAALRGITH